MTTPQSFDTATLPAAGPSAKPQMVEIDVAPWQRIAVLFRAVHATRTEESGSVWYWRPDAMSRIDLMTREAESG